MDIDGAIKRTARKYNLIILIGIILLVSGGVVIYNNSLKNNFYDALNISSIPTGRIKSGQSIQSFYSDHDFLEHIEDKDENFIRFSSSSLNEFYTGFTIYGPFKMNNLGSVKIVWRLVGDDDLVDIHLVDTPPFSEKDNFVGEDYIKTVSAPGEIWETVIIPLEEFLENRWWQPDGVFNDGKFDYTNIHHIQFGLNYKNNVALDIKEITLSWVNDISIYVIFLSLAIIISIIFIYRTHINLVIINRQMGNLTYALYNRIISLILSLCFLIYVALNVDVFYSNPYLLLLFTFLIISFLDDFIWIKLQKFKIYEYRYILAFLLSLPFIKELDYINFILLITLLLIPLVPRRKISSLIIHFTLILLGIVFLSSFPIKRFYIIISVIQMILAFIKMEKKSLMKKRTELKDALELYNGIFLYSSEIICTLTPNGIITTINKAFESVLNVISKDVIGNSILDYIAAEDQNKFNLDGSDPGKDVKRFDAKIGSSIDRYHVAYCCLNPILSHSVLTGYQLMATDITDRVKMEKELEALANIDGLTGISNRRSFDTELDREIRRAYRTNSPLALLFIDVDYFKPYNDTYGHSSGDECLKAIASNLKNNLQRASDLVARYGGEEFVVLLPDTDSNSAEVVAKRLKKSIYDLELEHNSSEIEKYVTISIGISVLQPEDFNLYNFSIKQIVDEADKALYMSKKAGRNRYTVYKPPKGL